MLTYKYVLNKHKFYKKLSVLVFYLSILTLVIAFNFSDNPVGGWQLQTLPFLNNRPLRDMTFTDSLTGYGITKGGNGDSDYVIKTYNGGDNWSIMNTFYAELNHIKFINSNTGFICGGDRLGRGLFLKTTNSGNSWNQINTPEVLQIIDMSVISEDSLWITGSFFSYYLFSSTNGGLSWDLKYETGSGIEKIYIDKNFGFLGNQNELIKSKNYGNNWTLIPNQIGFSNMLFLDSLKGWKCYDSLKMTTDGGNTWTFQNILNPGGSMNRSIGSLSNIGKDTIWGGGVTYQFFPNLQSRGVVHFTSNGGLNWFFQIPDTSYHLGVLYNVNFFNSTTGWLYSVSKGIQTKTGGDNIFYPITEIKNENIYTPEDFHLSQNYPNPFNPATKINYELRIKNYVSIIVYDVLGNKVKTLVNKTNIAGNYEVEFDGSNLPSGVYFYKLEIINEKSKEVYSETKRMILLK